MAHAERGGTYAGAEEHAREDWIRALVTFSGVMMILIGLFHVVMALTAIVRNTFYLVLPNYVFSFNVSAWGWTHLGLGILIGLTGISLLAGQRWARIVALVLVGLSALGNFLFIPYQPVWSLLILAVDVLVIWALSGYLRRPSIVLSQQQQPSGPQPPAGGEPPA